MVVLKKGRLSGTFMPKKLDTNVGTIKIMVIEVSRFITLFILLDIIEAKVSRVAFKMSVYMRDIS